MRQFHEKRIIVGPGDSMKVKLKIEEEYDRYGNNKKIEYEVIKIYDIISGIIDEKNAR